MSSGLLAMPLPGLGDAEGDAVPAAAVASGEVIDAHVHLFPDRLFAAIWRWFDRHGWPIRYPLRADEVIEFLRARGVGRMVALHYAHKPGMARGLNSFMAEVCGRHPGVCGLATVLPGEPEAGAIVEEGFAMGLGGVKLHCHVQCFAPDAAEVTPVYERCAEAGLPLVLHAGREPKSPGYACDPHQLCMVERVEAVLRAHPRLKLVVPHLGLDEVEEYAALLDRHPNLWLDTTMVLAGYFPVSGRTAELLGNPWPLLERHADRIMYGTDFPNIPYAWDRELQRLAAATENELSETAKRKVLGETAAKLFFDE
jgi:predicted TIM-barrel fold metal-dependent hydrolase